MTIRFVHAADIHLGYRQYGSDQRYNDFASAFQALVDDTIARDADFLLLAGDLFHKRAIDPLTLLQATLILEDVKTAGIPVYAVQGNHERPHYTEHTSWLDYLAEMGLLRLLTARYREGDIIVEPWDPDTKRGAYVDLPGGIRVIGLQYFGATTSRVVGDLVGALEEMPGPRPAYTILMMHAGLQGILDNYAATLSRAQLEPLRSHVDYVALGHIHKPFRQDDWIYNPGSPETTGANEVAWEDRGYLVVDVDTARTPAHAVTTVQNPRRLFLRYPFAVDGYDTPEDLEAALMRHLRTEVSDRIRDRKPVVEVELRGALPFSRADLDIGRLEKEVTGLFDAILCRFKDGTVPSEFDIELSENMTRADLERHVVRELVERDVRHRAQSEAWSDLILRLKDMALTGSAPQEIVEALGGFASLLAAPQNGEEAAQDGGDVPQQEQVPVDGAGDGASAEDGATAEDDAVAEQPGMSALEGTGPLEGTGEPC
ncbi:MAG: exonuclease SbcCD subunit D [Chloroflexi bacterium]|nr:exonuclease SbcCD subunit D [Chloroflexota bacterium]